MATEATEVSNNDDLFVDGAAPAETTEDASELDPGTETPSDALEGDQAGEDAENVEAQETPEASGEEATIELPKQQMKQYPDELVAEYARRFDATLEDVKGNRSLLFAVKKAIDSDIYLQTLEGKLSAQTSTEEVAKTAAAQPTLTPAQALEQHEARLGNFVDTVFSKEVISQKGSKIGDYFARALGIDPNTKDKNLVGVVRGLREQMPNVLRELAILAVDANEASSQYIVPSAMDRVYPGFQEERAEKLFHSAYDEVRKSNKDYAKMPEFMSPNFKAELDKAAAKIPGFDKMRFEGSQKEQAKARYEILAVGWKLASGQSLSVDEAKSVYDAAQKDAKKASVAKVGSNLGSGQSKGQLAPKAKGNDDIFGAQGEYPLNPRI